MPVTIQCDPYSAVHSCWRLAVGARRVVPEVSQYK